MESVPSSLPFNLSTSVCCCGMFRTCRRDGQGWDGHHEDGAWTGGTLCLDRRSGGETWRDGVRPGSS